MSADLTPEASSLAVLLEPESPPPPRRRGLRVVGRLVLAALMVSLAAGTVVLLDDEKQPPPAPRFAVEDVAVSPGEVPPAAGPVPPDLAGWARRVSDATDIPVRTLVAYGKAEAKTRTRDPGCNLSWVTLAGVGRVESHHGRYSGTTIGEDGTLSKPIIGVPLDGSPGVQAIPDTDRGTLDGDAQWDRAVGSMQFLPATWSRWSLRAADDGRAPDPQNVDDSALTAANYLCAVGGDLSTGAGWWRAVLTYNQSNEYARSVYSGAAAYARKANELSPR